MDLTDPVLQDHAWQFEFSVETPAVFDLPDSTDPLAALRQDCESVPMVTGLGEHHMLVPVLCPSGDQQNIWFHVLNSSTDTQP